MTEAQRAERWMTVAVVLAAFLSLFAVVVGVVNYDHLRADSAQRAHDRNVQVAQAKAESDAQIAQAKREAAQQVAVAKAEVQTQLCELIAVLQPSPVGTALAAKEGCTPDGHPLPMPSATSSPSSSVPPAGPNRLESPGRTNTTGGTVTTRPSAHPTPSASPSPSMSPTPGLLCVLLNPLIPTGGCP